MGSLARSLLVDLEYDYKHGRGLYLEFQPQIASATGRVKGVEALLRWNHVSYGSIPAPITIALAEDPGLIGAIGLWVFDTACAVRRDWLDRGIEDLTMSVNVSALQLRRGFPQKLLESLHAHGLPPSLVSLEVTESAALGADTPESRILTHLYESGLLLAIDDFGMGHSSLKYLKQFPVSAVKIDGAISREVVTNPICQDIVASITRLCRARRMTSVAEFVEDDDTSPCCAASGATFFRATVTAGPSLPGIACVSSLKPTAASPPPRPGLSPSARTPLPPGRKDRTARTGHAGARPEEVFSCGLVAHRKPFCGEPPALRGPSFRRPRPGFAPPWRGVP
ncbi:MAG: EAL domain-containing protein [Bilophila sp.]